MKELSRIALYAGKTCMFVLLFLSLIQPFGIDTVKQGRIMFILTETLCSFVSVVFSMFLTNIIMHNRIEKESQRKALTHLLTFFLINTPILGAMLLTFVSWFNDGDPLLYWHTDDGRFNYWGWGTMTMYVSCVSVIVGIVVFYQLRNSKLQQRIAEMEEMNQLLEKRQEKKNVEEDLKSAEEMTNDSGNSDARIEVDNRNEAEERLVEFCGQGQKSYLKVAPQDIIYVESMANYTDICHITNDEIHHSTLRITLKQTKSVLADADYILQCHRAFLVNINFIQKITDRNSGYQLQLFGLEKPIPVSRTNENTIKQRLQEN